MVFSTQSDRHTKSKFKPSLPQLVSARDWRAWLHMQAFDLSLFIACVCVCVWEGGRVEGLNHYDPPSLAVNFVADD